MSWAKTALKAPTYHLERATHWHKMLTALAAPVNQANYHTLAYAHCGMAIDALPPDAVTEKLRTVREEIWDHQKCETPLPDVLKMIATAIRRAQQDERQAAVRH